ncbi:MAG: FAD-binding dehydrogenase [Chloroflexi bacterium HGW-Chloroflexi-10]|nr:MAG: FAD-binding dehydrogenase [Chloroflexi bacterium HGW-Chloroflexi-10]
MKSEKLGLNRRDFLKGTALAAGAGLLAGCAPRVVDSTAKATETPAGTEDWLGQEPAIGSIAETIESDVIVIGAGTGGAYVAASLLEKGIKTILLEKNATVSTLRNDWGAVDSKWQVEEGVKLDKAAILHYHAMYSANRIDQRLPRIWANESGAAIDWIGELLEKRGAKFYFEGGYEPDFSSSTYPKFPTGHSGDFAAGTDGATIMKEYIEELGGVYHFDTSFVKFEHEGKKVTAAIATNKDGKQIRFVGKKGIVLSTGGYQNNPAMMNALQPADVMIMTKPMPGAISGDGIKACLWMGAAMDECHSSMLFDRMGLLPNETPATMTVPGFFWLGSQPWLKVNLLGERFTNESGPYDFILHAAARQPGATYCAIMDSAWFEQVTQFSTTGCSRIYPFPNGSPNDVFKTAGLESTGTDLAVIKEEWTKILQGLIDSGHLQMADTPEELAAKLNIPADTFAATFNRYNELAEKGVDEDFYKDAYRLLPLKSGPYYGIRLTGWHLCTLDGIRIDTQMRPLDAMNEPFEGLSVIGDSSGSYFAHTYPNLFTGYANGRTTTFARRVARIIAGEPENL